MPVVDGRSPISKLVREALQPGAVQWALVNNMPLLASRSMFGVIACGWPPRLPIQSFKSSTAMNRTLRGGLGSAALVLLDNANVVIDSNSTITAG